MAVRKTRNFLPSVFQTDTNEKFLSATMDQLVSEPVLTNLYGYIGRKFAPTFKEGDSYIRESSADRQDYQLEPSTVARDQSNNVTFFSSYVDFLNKLKYYGAFIDNQSRLFTADYYSFDPLISFDKLVNFSQYYWLPDGPDPVLVDTTGIPLEAVYNVTRNVATGEYVFTLDGIVDNSIILPRGGTYKFIIDQPGYPFWIQTELGDGYLNATPTLSSRDIFGVENNGTDSGTITFTIPQKTAQDRFVNMPLVYSVDYATPARYSDWENKTISQFQSAFPEWSGITGQLQGKELIFVDQNQYNNEGDIPWTVPSVINPTTGNIIPGYDAGTIISEDQRYVVWQVQLLDIGINDPLIRLVRIQDVSIDQKVYIRYGVVNANKEYYKDYDGFFHQTPLLSSLADTLFAQDGVDGAINKLFKVVDYAAWQIDVNTDILGQQNYTSPNGVQFTSGLKIRFLEDITPSEYQNREFYVEGVGDLGSGITLVPVDELVTPELYNDENALNYPNQVFPDYITIVRSSVDRNAWSRNNRWFHREVITKTAEYRSIEAGYYIAPIFDQQQRALRPIVQFEASLQLFNDGRVGKYPVDVIDSTVIDPFLELEGKVLTTAFGVPLVDGMRVIFESAIDPLVLNKIYVLNLVQYTVDSTGAPSGPEYIKFTKADDGDVETYDTVVVTQGQNKGKQYWYNGTAWLESQQKTANQQEPLFDVFTSGFDYTTGQATVGRSLSEYTRSEFKGTKLFGYLKNSAGTVDPVLGFALTYRNLGTQGDIEFENYFNTDTFSYANDQGFIVTENISSGFLQKAKDRYTLSPRNTWTPVVEASKQYQSIGYVYDGTSNVFPIDVTPNTATSIPYVKVYKNFKYLTADQWVLVSNQVRLTTSEIFIGDGYTSEFRLTTVTSTVDGVIVLVNGIARKSVGYYSVTGLVVTFYTAPKQGDKVDIRTIQNPNLGDKIDILVYSNETSDLGFYQVPINLDLNAQNVETTTVTLGQMRNHLVALGQNSTTVVGNVLGVSNLRDIDIKQQGGTILQHSAPIPYGELFLLDEQANFFDSIRFAQKEYTKFKNKFLELSTSLSGIQPTDPAASVDLILTEINKIKNSTFPWFYSDMIPYGTLKNTITYTVFDPLKTDYELTQIFNDNILTNQAVLIYLNDVQLIKNTDYAFRTDRPAVTILSSLEVDDLITIVEYADTDGCYVPETPTKLGLWPKWIPTIFFDDTYREPINVIQGHDGSITPAFGDYRDGILLELEKRIYNNIKIPDTGTYQDIFSVIPGKFRKTDYSLNEITQLVSQNFQSWVGNNKLDFSANDTFESNDPFTWNYGAFNDRISGEQLPGSWRACYQYFYDTFRPHITPWEMLGFTSIPDWWVDFYGPAPYTSGNKLLWDDLEAGIIRYGPRVSPDPNYARPGLATIIPVDENGFLRSPIEILTASYSANRAAGSWTIGQYGPVEFAWRTSSDFPYAVQQAIALSIPAKYFSIDIDTYIYSPYNATWDYTTQVGQYLNLNSNRHLNQVDILFNGEMVDGTVYRGSGYINWIADFLTSQGVDPATKINGLVQNYQVNLAYKLAGFTDQSYLNVLAEQVSPSTTNDTIVIPNENYKVHLNKSAPTQKLVYSGVIVEKTSNGYSIRGYNLNDPIFTIIPSVINNNAVGIKVLNSSATIFLDYQDLKLTVPYGYEFTNQQQVVDFLISYERYLLAQGFTFNDRDNDLGELRNWTLSAKEFLYWAQQGWKSGSILVLSPVANTLNAISINSIVDGITDTQYGSRVVDQNFKLIKNVEYDVMRSSTNFKVTLTNSASVIGFVELDLVQYEHVLIFDNSTVFNDIIYKPELGNRQYRLKLVGQKSAGWDGSLYAPGFVYNSGVVDAWVSGKDYLQGDLVLYKNQYYTALQNIIATTDFQYSYWQQISASQIQTGLLPNFSTLGARGIAYYDSYPSIDNKKEMDYSHGLIGYRPRQYLADLGLTETTQIEFYKGYIKQKGTLNSVNQMSKTEFNNLTSNISLYEEWAIRVGTYGALDTNPYVEIALDEKKFGVNPALAQFVGSADSNLGDGLTIFNKSQLYKSTDQYDGNIALNRTPSSNYDNDILTAGYVNIDDIDTEIFDLADYASLNDRVSLMGSGYLIWCAKDFNQQWDVLRVTETNNHVNLVTNSGNSTITFTSVTPHGLAEGDIFIVSGFGTAEFDGVWRVNQLVDLNNVLVDYTGNLAGVTTVAGYGVLFVLNSMRFQYMEDSRIYGLSNPPNGWKVGDKIWIDDDAQTTAVQGQPFGTQPSGTWKVYEKTNPWSLGQRLNRASSEYSLGDGYGTTVKMSADNLIVVTGSPWSGNGLVNTFIKDYQGIFQESLSITPSTANTKAFGSVVDLAADSNNTSYLAIGAPQSAGNVGYVGIYKKPTTSTTYTVNQILTGNLLAATADTFGTSLAFNQDGSWLYVGAPGNDRVYLYGLNKSITYKTTTVSINNENIITLGNTAGPGTIKANVGDVIYEPITSATIKVLAATWPAGNSNVTVNSLTNIIPAPGATNTLANIILSAPISANTGQYITQSTSGANIYVYRGIANESRLYGLYQNTNRFDTIGNIIIGGNASIIVGVHPTYIGSGNLLLNGVDTGLYANVTYSRAVKSTISFSELGFIPEINDVNSLLVTSGGKTYVPGVDYTLDFSGNIVFSSNIAQSDITVTQQPYYFNLGTVSGNAGSNFGYALSSSFDGAQLAVGAPLDSVPDATGNLLPGAGSVWVFDRVIEAFKSTGSTDYTTRNTIQTVHRVTIDNIEVNNYSVIGANTIRFITPPPIGVVIYIETNRFILLEKLIGIDSLTGGLGAIQANTYFGTSLTICSNNCAIYIGAPNYDNGIEFNTGAVWKFHNRGRLYGTNNGYTQNPVFTPGDSIRLDNYEIVVSGRMMPTTLANSYPANTLALSSSIVANIGEVISQNLGSGYYANVTVLANTSPTANTITSSQFITVSGYMTANTFSYGPGNVVSIGNLTVRSTTTAYPMASLDSLVKDINDAELLGITATNSAGELILNSDSTVAKNLLRILAGNTRTDSIGVYAAADMRIFAFMQIIINPYHAAGEYFGSKVKLAANAYMLVIGSGRGTTRGFATFDLNKTTLDNRTTRMFDQIQSSGSVYVYELYDDPRNEVENPGRYSFAQQLNPGDLNTGDQFGYALDIEGTYITVSAPNDDTVIPDGGSVYIFENPTLTRGWNLIRYQEPKVDVDSMSRIYLYNNQTNTILDNLQFIDPAKGRILGQAEQEISYKTEYDPAIYNRGTNPAADINANIFWSDNQVGKVWWNLSMVRFIDYEQDTLAYRTINWGKVFPGSTIEICEWVESTVLPSNYVANGGDGIPKYADNSAYVELIYVDPTTNIISSKYYYWVTNKTSVDPNDETRNLPIASVADIIANPKNQGITYAAVIKDNAIILYNLAGSNGRGSLLSAQNTILHIDYQLIVNSNIIHSEYELVQKGNPINFVPDNIVNKLIDSLSGVDRDGAVVPDPKLTVSDRYGIDIRPRQGMFVDRLSAVNELVAYVNSVLIDKPVARQYDLSQLYASEPEPSYKNGEYDQRVETEVELTYIDPRGLPTGYKILVAQDTSQDNLWVLYELQADKSWLIVRVQSYKTNLYWDYVDWFAKKADGTYYSLADKLDFVVPTYVDAKKLPVVPGEEILVRVNASDQGGWNLLVVDADLNLDVVGIENGTLQLKTSLGDFSTNELGFGNQGYSTDRYDQNPNIEIRNIIQALKDDIFINELQGEFNNSFFVMINYLFSEQKYIDWIFKTSFISVMHDLRKLLQYPAYVKDNQTYYQNYIEEVKPYRTKLREYLINYTGDDTYPSTVTDFDLPAYYDTTSGIFRSPSGEGSYVAADEALWQTYPYNQWYNNRKYIVDSILITNPGSGYSTEPTVTIVSAGGGGAGAKAVARIDGNTGAVTQITVTSAGSGYLTAPTVIINGSSTTPATAYAVIKNNQVRTFDTTLKFDRISYTSTVKEWAANTAYTAGDIVTYAYQDGNAHIRKAYTVNANITTGNNFVGSDYTVFAANAFTNANDRIIGYYQPTDLQPARDLNQLLYGIEYPGVQVQGPKFNINPLFGGTFDITDYDSIDYDSDGNPILSISAVDTVIQSQYTDAALGTRAEDINVDGGAYVDRYSSHAPEEMVPGIVFDTLDMRVFTQGNASVYGYRIFTNMLKETKYFRIADNYTTTLSNALSISDTLITVSNSSVLPSPDPTYSHNPGVVFIGAERITYWRNYAHETPTLFGNSLIVAEGTLISDSANLIVGGNLFITTGNVYESTGNISNIRANLHSVSSQNILGQIRRGTQGTAVYTNTYPIGTLVTDSSSQQEVQGSVSGNIILAANTSYRVTSVVSYTLTLSNSITANVGDFITQATTGANATVLAFENTADNKVTINYNNPLSFDFLGNTVVALSNIAINGSYTGNVYPVISVIAGEFINAQGNVTILANTKLNTANIWLNPGSGTATDGLGFIAANTAPANFIKQELATINANV